MYPVYYLSLSHCDPGSWQKQLRREEVNFDLWLQNAKVMVFVHLYQSGVGQLMVVGALVEAIFLSTDKKVQSVTGARDRHTWEWPVLHKQCLAEKLPPPKKRFYSLHKAMPFEGHQTFKTQDCWECFRFTSQQLVTMALFSHLASWIHLPSLAQHLGLLLFMTCPH